MQTKRVTSAGLDQFLRKMIMKIDKAPANFHKMRRIAKETTTDIKAKGKKLNIPWGLLLILIPGLIITYFIITSIKRPEDKIDNSYGEPISLKGRETEDLLDDFGWKGK